MKLNATAMLALVLSLLFVTHADATDLFQVKRVIDGDTFRLTTGRLVRYIGINAPEIGHLRTDGTRLPGEYLGEVSAVFHRRLLGSSKVMLQVDREKQDHYGRLLAYVFTADGEKFINEMIILEGYAYCLPVSPNLQYEKRLLAAQHKAMQAGKGLWQDFAQHLAARSKVSVFGNRASKRFHITDCPYGSKCASQNRVVFRSIREAFWAGYAPCKRCLGELFKAGP